MALKASKVAVEAKARSKRDKVQEYLRMMTTVQKQSLWRLEGTPKVVEERKKKGLPVWDDVKNEMPKLDAKLRKKDKPAQLTEEQIVLCGALTRTAPATVPSRQGDMDKTDAAKAASVVKGKDA